MEAEIKPAHSIGEAVGVQHTGISNYERASIFVRGYGAQNKIEVEKQKIEVGMLHAQKQKKKREKTVNC